jgi:hypothetical protein
MHTYAFVSRERSSVVRAFRPQAVNWARNSSSGVSPDMVGADLHLADGSADTRRIGSVTLISASLRGGFWVA